LAHSAPFGVCARTLCSVSQISWRDSTLRVSAEAPSTPQAHQGALSPAVRLLLAAGTSFYGDWLTTVALVVLLFRITGSPVGPALYIVARSAPRVLGPLPGGALADRFGPARVAASCAALQAVITASIVVFAEQRLVWAIYVAVVAAQLLGSAAQPCYGALVPAVTTPARLGRVQGAYSALQSSSILVGPAVGAIVLPFVSPEILIAIDAVSFVIAALVLATLLNVGRRAAGARTTPGGVRVGLRLVARDPMLRFLAAASVANPAAVTALQAVLVVAAAQHFGHDTVVGWLYAAVGAGGLIGTFPIIRKTPARVGLRWIIGPSVLELAPLAVFVFITNLPVAMLLLFVSSIGATLYQTRGTVGLQQRVAPDVLGRANAVIGFAIYVGMLLGAVAALSLVQPLGWESTVLTVCAASATLLFFTAVSEGQRSGG
jgi:MFS family permease